MEFKADKKYIKDLLGDDARFIVPAYQRPYSWEEDQCETLWEDILNTFGSGEDNNIPEYFLGSIVTYQEENKKELSIIDGQQRITTFTIIFRALFEHLASEQLSERLKDYVKECGKRVWQNDIDRNPIFLFDQPHLIINEVITQKNQDEFKILLQEKIDVKVLRKMKQPSRYVKNFLFFYDKMREFRNERTTDWERFAKIFFIAKKLFVLLIVCDNQESAMTIFNTLNSRGMALSNADVIKGYIYVASQEKESVARKWKDIEETISQNDNIKDMDFLFQQLMHIIKAQNKEFDATNKSSLVFFTKKGMYGKDEGWLTHKQSETIQFIALLANFWVNPGNHLSERSMKYMDILEKFFNAEWKSFVSCMVWKNQEKIHSKHQFDRDFSHYLPILIKYITLYLFHGRAFSSQLKGNIYKMNTFYLNPDAECRPDLMDMPEDLDHFLAVATETSNVSRYMLSLWSHIYNNFSYDLYEYEVEHILPKKWQKANFDGWDEKSHKEYLEQIGNKILLPKKSNIAATNNFFAKKQEEYKKVREIKEVKELGERDKKNWDKADIETRNQKIYNGLVEYFNSLGTF